MQSFDNFNRFSAGVAMKQLVSPSYASKLILDDITPIFGNTIIAKNKVYIRFFPQIVDTFREIFLLPNFIRSNNVISSKCRYIYYVTITPK